MGYKYYLSGSPTYTYGPGTQWIRDFQAVVDDQYDNAPNAYSVQEETALGSGSFLPVDVRVDRGINVLTGEKYGDDYKLLIFRDLSHATGLGIKYYFDGSYWLVFNTEIKKNFAASALVRRCNNVLRWVGSNGTYYEEPCIIDYVISKASSKYSDEDPVTPLGNRTLYAQHNATTRNLKNNQRLLFGNVDNWTCFRVLANGIRNYLNNDTFNNDSNTMLEVVVESNYVNRDTDNLTLGIADYYKYSSGSSVNSMVVTPNEFSVIEGETNTYNVQYYSGSTPISGSMLFSVSGSTVPVANYVFSVIDGNNFSVYNTKRYFDNTLNILCSGNSGSRIIELNLTGDW